MLQTPRPAWPAERTDPGPDAAAPSLNPDPLDAQDAADAAHAPAADGAFERVAGRLLDGLRWRATVFHVGQYCGRWRATTAGRARASFHLVLEGRCWLHRPGQPSLALATGDGVLLPRDVPHVLSPYSDGAIACEPQAMQPLTATPGGLGATGLACGFFDFEGPLHPLLLAALPAHVLLRADEAGGAGAAALFPLMLAEARRQDSAPSALMDRLCGLLFFYALRRAAQQGAAPQGLWALLRRPGFAPLLLDLLAQPELAWTVEQMARRVHLSRAAFFRQFGEACGQSPLQFLLLLRMQLAAQRLEQGEPIARAAEAVGYASYAAFARAFKRVVGEQPGAWQRARTRVPR